MKTKFIALTAFLSSCFTVILTHSFERYGIVVFILTTVLLFLLIVSYLMGNISSSKYVIPKHKIGDIVSGDIVSGDLSKYNSIVRIHKSEYNKQRSEYISVYIVSDDVYNYIVVCRDGVETIGSISKKQ